MKELELQPDGTYLRDGFVLHLPTLPEDWHWEIGEDDGDPAAHRPREGWVLVVHEGEACKGYTGNLSLSTYADPAWTGPRGNRPVTCQCVPVDVFVAVAQALEQHYARD